MAMVALHVATNRNSFIIFKLYFNYTFQSPEVANSLNPKLGQVNSTKKHNAQYG